MSSNVISIEPFEAEYAVRQMGGGEKWYSCRVVGIADDSPHDSGRFLIITDDEDGNLYTGSANKVRRAEA
ncbi:hypothetical protein [Mesorhizobium loti]|uniref:hypothetical protein n=1 Tax=Rhizobium loti TaxID=381 RepID=UPI0012BC01C1|nr:hypothetical protein [Mesorhizobium loti]